MPLDFNKFPGQVEAFIQDIKNLTEQELQDEIKRKVDFYPYQGYTLMSYVLCHIKVSEENKLLTVKAMVNKGFPIDEETLLYAASKAKENKEGFEGIYEYLLHHPSLNLFLLQNYLSGKKTARVLYLENEVRAIVPKLNELFENFEQLLKLSFLATNALPIIAEIEKMLAELYIIGDALEKQLGLYHLCTQFLELLDYAKLKSEILSNCAQAFLNLRHLSGAIEVGYLYSSLYLELKGQEEEQAAKEQSYLALAFLCKKFKEPNDTSQSKKEERICLLKALIKLVLSSSKLSEAFYTTNDSQFEKELPNILKKISDYQIQMELVPSEEFLSLRHLTLKGKDGQLMFVGPYSLPSIPKTSKEKSQAKKQRMF